MHNFILVCTDAVSEEGAKLSAQVIADKRLSAGRWPLYTRTPYQRRMTPGDRIVVYLGGSDQGAKCFYAVGAIDSVQVVDRKELSAEWAELEGAEPATSWILLTAVQHLNPRVPVSQVLAKLSFAPKNPVRWGVVFMSGVRSLNETDWEIITGKRS